MENIEKNDGQQQDTKSNSFVEQEAQYRQMILNNYGDNDNKITYKSSRKLLESFLKICLKQQLRERCQNIHPNNNNNNNHNKIARELQTILVHGESRSSIIHFVNDALNRIAHCCTHIMIIHISMDRLIESRHSLENIFKVANKMHPSIICIEDIDRFMMNDTQQSKLKGNFKRLFNQFIDFINNLKQNNNNEDIIIIGQTNLLNNLHAKILKLFRKHIYVPEPTIDERYRFLLNEISEQYNDHCLLNEQDIRYFSEITKNYSFADLRTIIEHVCINNDNGGGGGDCDFNIDQSSINGLTLEMLMRSKQKIPPS
uniref:Uncharacterized protein LOC113792419 n=1 Tax=Dermatophagoides pteronyssinus TaxID=6956 RepID=A0A6P6XY61_DERPT|nr:uncharacterized protein LOC113792419 [Dermatophagoides pteronyssinus]